jgi:hypothetical protein
VKPARIQRKRTAGYDMQAASRAVNGLPCVSVTRPGRWGNPYDVRVFGRELSMKLFRNTIHGVWSPDPVKHVSDELCDLAYAAHHRFLKRLGGHPLEIIEGELGGRNLACYCQLPTPGEPDLCHADILLEYAARPYDHGYLAAEAADAPSQQEFAFANAPK